MDAGTVWLSRHSELRNILNSCIEEWYGSQNGSVVSNRQYISTDDVYAMLSKIDDSINGLKRTGYGLGAG